jgi:hypothetical protein
VASNLSYSARSGSEGIVISSHGPNLRATRRGPKTNKAVALQDFSLQESLLKRSYWDTNFSIRKGAIFLCAPIRNEDQLISTVVLIRNNSRITGYAQVIPGEKSASGRLAIDLLQARFWTTR